MQQWKRIIHKVMRHKLDFECNGQTCLLRACIEKNNGKAVQWNVKTCKELLYVRYFMFV